MNLLPNHKMSQWKKAPNLAKSSICASWVCGQFAKAAFAVGIVLTVGGLFSLSYLSSFAASAPNILPYQGRLLNSNGVPVADLSLDFQFRIFDASGGGTCLWSNADSACGLSADQTVTLTDGLFTENLGDTGAGYAAIPDTVFANNTDLFLEVEVEGEVLSPRKRIGAAGFALNADTLDGLDSTDFATATGVDLDTVYDNDADKVLDVDDGSGLAFNMNFGTLVDVTSAVSTTASLFRVRDDFNGVHIELSRSDIVQRGSNLMLRSQEGEMSFETGTTERMRIDSSGEVGIGTASPDNALDVVGTIDSTGFVRSTDAAGVPSTGTGVELVYPTGVPWLGTGILDAINRDTDAMRPISINASDITFRTSTTGAASFSQPRVTIDASGNVGMGNTSPAMRLSVWGVPITAGVGDQRILQELIDTTPFAAGVGAGLTFGGFRNGSGDPTDWAGIKGIKANGISDDAGAHLVFMTRGTGAFTGTSETERMRIDSSGFVGINDTTPDGRFDVDGGTLADDGRATNISATFPSSYDAGAQIASLFSFATAGADNDGGQFGVQSSMAAGYTGNQSTKSFYAENFAAGVGAYEPVANNTALGFNTGLETFVASSTVGSNIGVLGRARSSTGVNAGLVGSADTAGSASVNYGVIGNADAATVGGSDNVGVAGFARNGDATIGGFFGLHSTPPTYTGDAALVADNDGVAANIFEARDAGTAVFTIGDGGTITSTASTFNCADCLDFDDFANGMAVDESTTIAMDAAETLTISNGSSANFIVDLTAAGDFVIQDAGSPFATFNDAGNVSFENTVTIGSTNADLVLFNAEVDTHFIPNTDATYDLGSSANRWRDLYLDGTSLHIGDASNEEGLISYTDAAQDTFNFSTDATANADIAFFTDDLYLDKSAGFVGINDATPDNRLDIDVAAFTGTVFSIFDTTAGAGMNVTRNSITTIGTGLILEGDVAASNAFRINTDGVNRVNISGTDGYTLFGDADSFSATEFITAIKNDAASGVLDGFRMERYESDAVGTNGLGVSIDFAAETSAGGGAQTMADIQAQWEDASNASPDGSLIFRTNVAGTMTEAMRVDDLSRVGIGTASPTDTLSVAGSANTLPIDPVAVGSVGSSSVSRVHVVGGYAYSASGTGDFQIFDVTDPSAPALISTLTTDGNAEEVRVAGRYAYLVTQVGASDFYIIDVSNPDAPTTVATMALSASGARGIYVSGHYAYLVMNEGDLRVIDVSVPTAPVQTDSVSLTSLALAVTVQGDYAYAVGGNTATDFSIVDISNPADITVVGTMDLADFGRDIKVVGRYAYIANNDSSDTADEFRIIDVSDPTTPTLVGSLNIDDSALGLDVAGDYAYVTTGLQAGDEFFVIDISDPTTPVETAAIPLGLTPAGIQVSGRYAYFGMAVSGMQIYDIFGTNFHAVHAGTLEAGTIHSVSDTDVGNNLLVRGGLDVGAGGIKSEGSISASGDMADYMLTLVNDGNADTRFGMRIQGCLDANPTSACDFIQFNDGDGTASGVIEGNGAGGVAYTTTGTDFAELFPGDNASFNEGDIVTVDETTGLVRLADRDDSFVGVVSHRVGFIGNAVEDWEASGTYVPVGLLGQIPVPVSDENGPIAAGDVIAVSVTPGVGTKMTLPGHAVGVALESFAGPGIGSINVLVRPTWHSGNTISNDGSLPTVTSNLAMNSTGTADATTQGYASHALLFRGSGWDGAAAQDVSMSLVTDVTDATDYRLSIKNTSGTTTAFVNDDGDLAIAGKFYPSSMGTLQTDKYVYYGGVSDDYIRTNASGFGTGSYDFAEMFPSSQPLEAGDVVVFDAMNEHVRKSASANETKLAGIVSTKPGFLAGTKEPNTYPIALAGRVPTKVSTENGTIEIGDPLTSSSTQGVAMKATNPGMIVGYALEPLTNGTGTVIAFVSVGYWSGTETQPMAGTDNQASNFSQNSAASFTTLDLGGDLYMHGNQIRHVSRIDGLAGAWSIEPDGTIKTAASVVTVIESYQGEKIEVPALLGLGNKIMLSGTSTLENGSASINFEDVDPAYNDVISTTAPIQVTAMPMGPVQIYLVGKDHDGFTVQQMNGADSGITFDWMVTAYRKGYEPVVVEETIEEVPAEEVLTEEIPPAEVQAEEAPPAEEPIVEDPVSEAPVEEAPSAEEPAAEVPAEEPAPVEEPVSEPQPEAPPAEEPVIP